MKSKVLFILLSIITFWSCKDKADYDATGNFESEEVIVSAQQNGVLLQFKIEEGQKLNIGDTIGKIDVESQKLQVAQVEATVASIQKKTVNAMPQIEIAQKQLLAQQEQLNYLKAEYQRLSNLVKAEAAPQKQLDDLSHQMIQTEKQMVVTRQQITSYSENAALQNRSILSEKTPLQKSADLIKYQISLGTIINPKAGTVLTKYATQGEIATFGRPLYKIANLDTLKLKAYITGNQLPQIKLGQNVHVRIDDGKESFKTYRGVITWISNQSEFTPKSIQTKNERQNLVYAIKIAVPNDGYLKIGMYGEVLFNGQ